MQERAPTANDPNHRLRRALAAQRLSPIEAVRSGSADAGDLARLSLVFDPRAPHRAAGRPGGSGSRGAGGCDICHGPVVTEGLCESCRKRMALPLVDAEAAKEASLAYRVQRAARQAAEREAGAEVRPRKGSGTADRSADDPGMGRKDQGPFRTERSPEGRLFLRHANGGGYLIGTAGRGFVTTQWVSPDGSPEGVRVSVFVEDFLRAHPEIGLSVGCANAVRTFGSLAE